MAMCGLTRMLVPAAVAGVLVSTFTASEAAGWMAAVLAAGAVYAITRVTGGRRGCGVPVDANSATAADPEPVVTLGELDDASELVDH